VMVFVGKAVSNNGLCMRKGEFSIYENQVGPAALRVGHERWDADGNRILTSAPVPNCGKETAVGISRPELEVRLAAMGLRLRRFPCDSYYDSWRLFGTEAV